MLKEALHHCGLIAILRGIQPDEAVEVSLKLYDAGFRVIEAPLNSPEPFDSIRRIRESLPFDCIVGAGTVYLPSQVEQVRAAGGSVIVMPHSDQAIIAAAKAAQMEILPGVATATEAFAAFTAGATLLKVFPADHLGPATMKAWLSVLPPQVGLIPVGGVQPSNVGTFVAAGAAGLGIGSSLYKPGMMASDVATKAEEFVAAWRAAKAV